jgi:hypothetical protein
MSDMPDEHLLPKEQQAASVQPSRIIFYIIVVVIVIIATLMIVRNNLNEEDAVKSNAKITLPDVPQNLKLDRLPDGVRLTWDKSDDPHQRLYVSLFPTCDKDVSRVYDVMSANEVILQGDLAKYYFGLTRVRHHGRKEVESRMSEIVSLPDLP